MMRIRIWSIVGFGACVLIHSLAAQPVRKEHVEAELIAEVASIRPGQPFWAGIRLRMEPHWHVYWKNPGDSGMAPSIDWELPPGFSVSEIFWPFPQKFDLPPLANFGYEGEVVLLAQVEPPESMQRDRAVLKAKVNWLVCKELCLPGNAELSLTLPVTTTRPEPNRQWAGLFERMRKRLPAPGHAWRFRASLHDSLLYLDMRPPETFTGVATAFFFPEQETLIEHAAEQTLIRNDAQWRLRMRLSSYFDEPPDSLRGVLVLYDKSEHPVLAVRVRAGFP